jgi:hypothetical protein
MTLKSLKELLSKINDRDSDGDDRDVVVYCEGYGALPVHSVRVVHAGSSVELAGFLKKPVEAA